MRKRDSLGTVCAKSIVIVLLLPVVFCGMTFNSVAYWCFGIPFGPPKWLEDLVDWVRPADYSEEDE